jgi:hypothetical protein
MLRSIVLKGQQLGLENIEISSLVPDPVTRDINLIEVSTESEEVENLSVIRDNRPQHKILVTEEIVNRDTSTPSPKFAVGRQVIKSDGVYVEEAIPSVSFISAGPPSPFIRISKPNKASSSISAIITSLSRVNLPNLKVKSCYDGLLSS